MLCLLLSRALTLSLVACEYGIVSGGDLRELTARDGGCAGLDVLNSLFGRHFGLQVWRQRGLAASASLTGFFFSEVVGFPFQEGARSCLRFDDCCC